MAEVITPQPQEQQPEAENTDQPQLILGKFKSEDDFAKSALELTGKLGVPIPEGTKLYGDGGLYKDLDAAQNAYKAMQTKLGLMSRERQPEAQAQSTSLDLDPDGDIPDGPMDVNIMDVVKKAGLNADDLIERFSNNGEFTPGQYEKLTDALQKATPGFKYNKWMINQLAKAGVAEYQAAQNQLRTLQHTAVEAVGGVDQWNNLRSWAKGHYDEANRNAITKMLQDPGTIKTALRILERDYAEAVGAGTGGVMAGSSAAQANALRFNTLAELNQYLREHPVHTLTPNQKKAIQGEYQRIFDKG